MHSPVCLQLILYIESHIYFAFLCTGFCCLISLETSSSGDSGTCLRIPDKNEACRVLPLASRHPGWCEASCTSLYLKQPRTGSVPCAGQEVLPWVFSPLVGSLISIKELCQLRWWRICLQYWRPGFDSWVGKIPWRREWQPTSVFLPGEFPRTEEPGAKCPIQLSY